LNRRIKKKKGLLESASYRKIKELAYREMEAEAKALEEKVRNISLPEQKD